MSDEKKQIDDGGPAFGFSCKDGEASHQHWIQRGMALREYFAIRAPEMPLWSFEVVGLPKRPESKKNSLGEEIEDALLEWYAIEQAMRLTQWRYVFADAMIAAGKVVR